MPADVYRDICHKAVAELIARRDSLKERLEEEQGKARQREQEEQDLERLFQALNGTLAMDAEEMASLEALAVKRQAEMIGEFSRRINILRDEITAAKQDESILDQELAAVESNMHDESLQGTAAQDRELLQEEAIANAA